jgi:hypothetical protein
MTPRRSRVGGKRRGAGRKPRAGVAASVKRTVKLTPDQAAAHDAARGDTPWSTWMVEAADLAIARGSTR